MSGLREKIERAVDDAIVSRRVENVLRVIAEPVDTQQVREQIVDALFYASDERITLDSDPSLIELTTAVMAVVADIVAARDAAVEQLERSLAAQELMATQFRTMQREKEHGWREAERFEAARDAALADAQDARGWVTKEQRRAERAEADLAAARTEVDEVNQQLAQVRAALERQEAWHAVNGGVPSVPFMDLHRALDASAQAAEHDGSGQ